MQTVGRNDRCPCGSGKKAKHCCQTLAIDRPRIAAEAHFALAQTFRNEGKLAEAAASLEQGLALIPDFAEGHSNLGLLYGELGKREAAVESFRKALAIKPDFAWAHCNLGNVLVAQGNLPAAIDSYRQALAIDPSHVEIWVNLGNALNAQDDVDAALACYRKALSIKPDYAAAWVNICAPLQAQGNLDAAIDSFRQALSLQPDFAEAESGLLFLLSIHPRYSPAQRLVEAQQYGARVMARAKPLDRWAVDPGLHAPPPRPLRVGLVSGDLRAHPVGFFIESILAHLDSGRIEMVGYPTTPTEDETTVRLKPRFAAWNSIAALSDEAAANQIRRDGIHVLVDLAGHTVHNRLPVFAWRPAPVQASWLGYFATTGVPTIDYLLADRVSVPESQRPQFTESIWYLPDTRFCFTPPPDSGRLQVSPLPASSNACLTFGCFQNALKLNDQVLATWGRIMAALPDARLRLLSRQMRHSAARSRMQDRLRRFGIALERVTLVGHLPREDYLIAHGDVDIILDTFPYSGATTTCEALWMGVPTMTLAGDTLVSRQGASILACAGLNGWIARDADDYVAKTLAHAADVDGLARLRSTLRQKVLASPLFDAARFARNLEAALEGMWQQRCS